MTPERIKELVDQSATEVVDAETQLRECEQDVQLLLEHNQQLCETIQQLTAVLVEQKRVIGKLSEGIDLFAAHNGRLRRVLLVIFGAGVVLGVVACRWCLTRG